MPAGTGSVREFALGLAALETLPVLAPSPRRRQHPRTGQLGRPQVTGKNPSAVKPSTLPLALATVSPANLGSPPGRWLLIRREPTPVSTTARYLSPSVIRRSHRSASARTGTASSPRRCRRQPGRHPKTARLGHANTARMIMVIARSIAEYTAVTASTTRPRPAAPTHLSPEHLPLPRWRCGTGGIWSQHRGHRESPVVWLHRAPRKPSAVPR